jgi:hypothetical protein
MVRSTLMHVQTHMLDSSEKPFPGFRPRHIDGERSFFAICNISVPGDSNRQRKKEEMIINVHQTFGT